MTRENTRLRLLTLVAISLLVLSCRGPYDPPLAPIDLATPATFVGGATATPVLEGQATPTPVATATVPLQPTPDTTAGPIGVPEGREYRIRAIERFLAAYPGSPLTPLAPLMVDLAEQYGLDVRLVPVISVLESGAGTDPNSCLADHNAWGYDSCGPLGRFASWEAGLEVVFATLASPRYQGDVQWKLCMWNMGGNCTVAQHYILKALQLMEGLW